MASITEIGEAMHRVLTISMTIAKSAYVSHNGGHLHLLGRCPMDQDALTLMRCLAAIPDPRQPRGVRHPFVGMLTLAIIGLMSRQVDLQAIRDHSAEHWSTLGPELGFSPWFGVPHQTTLGRLLGRVPLESLQAAFGRWLAQLVSDLPLIAAVDGKYPHQSRDAQGSRFGILTVFAHDLKICLAQWVVSDHEAEPGVLKAHLEELFARYPKLRVLTGDAIFAQRGLCEMLVALKRGYMLRIKGNQPNVSAALVEGFVEAPQRKPDAQSIEKARGAVETRRLWLDTELAAYVAKELNFAGAQQVARLDKTIKDLTTGEIKAETWYLVSYDPAGTLTARQFLGRARGHWGIENSLHHVKDRSWHEDKHTLRQRGLGPCFSVLVNIALTLLRKPGSFDPRLSMPRRAKRYEANPARALAVLRST